MSVAPTIVADCFVNLFGAIGAFVLAREATRSDPLGAMTRRTSFALRFVALLFLIRAFAWWFDDAVAFHLADVLAVATPLVSLFVAEGLVRRHAPAWLKRALIAGPTALIAAKTMPFVPASVAIGVLIATVVGGYLAVAHMLWTRDRASLTAGENASIRRVLLAMLVLAPLIVSDFRSIWPDVPVRLGAVGALLLLYLGFGSGSLHVGAGSRVATVACFAAIAGLFAMGYQTSIAGSDVAQFFRVAAVGFAGLLAAAIVSEARGAHGERSRPVTLLVGRTPAEFEASLATHPLLGNAQLLLDGALAHVRHPEFERLLDEQPVLAWAAAPWGRSKNDDGVERALSLMQAHEATHLVRLTSSPLRLMAVALPAIAVDARATNELHVARLAAELAYMKAAQA